MKVIILNGPMGVGKTSVGKHIADTNAGTAFIDGDWCLDLHPFVGNRETKNMAIDNILHMINNYRKCSFLLAHGYVHYTGKEAGCQGWLRKKKAQNAPLQMGIFSL